MRLTRRGKAVLAGAVVGIVLAALFGARSLNAVVGPALVALGAGAVQVHRADEPAVERTALDPGFPGDERTVRLEITAPGPTQIVEALDEGLAPDRVARDVAGDAVIEYDLRLVRRGLHGVGPARATITDALGLVAADYELGGREMVLVYPHVYPVTAPEAFGGLVDTAGTPDRQTFDRIREYQPGDPLRDVSWKASAKQPVPDDLVVVEFAAEDEGSVTVAVEGTDDVDRIASAGASVCAYLLDADLDVGLVTPDRRLDAGAGERQREAVLDVLARTGGGRLAAGETEAADVHVREARGGVVVEVRGREVRFDDLVDDRAFEESVAGVVEPGVTGEPAAGGRASGAGSENGDEDEDRDGAEAVTA